MQANTGVYFKTALIYKTYLKKLCFKYVSHYFIKLKAHILRSQIAK
uniref:Uncharacterized protein n=1 Tax=Ciona intestinalis TaxID=7719 RepID=H2XXE7_CIOIN